MISRIKHHLDKTTLFIVINSLIFFKLYYCSSVWAGTIKSNIAKLQLVQNFAARLLSDKRKFDHISPTLRKLKLHTYIHHFSGAPRGAFQQPVYNKCKVRWLRVLARSLQAVHNVFLSETLSCALSCCLCRTSCK